MHKYIIEKRTLFCNNINIKKVDPKRPLTKNESEEVNMSYLNDQVGYREELLATRSVIKKENYVLLEPDGLVKNSIPGYENCDVTILGSPAMGATFADYLVTVKEGGKNSGIGGEGLETFIYVLAGEVVVKNADKEESLTEGGYIFSPESVKVSFENKSGKEARLYVYKRRYEKIEGYSAFTVVGNANDIPWTEYEGMDNCHIKDSFRQQVISDLI